MAQQEDGKKNKGVFGRARLQVARQYVYPGGRAAMIAIGVIAGLGLLSWFVIDLFYLQSRLTTSGPLSSFHATFEKDCASCHVKFQSVTDAKCSVCHEKTGDQLGVYSLAAHEVYRSGDWSRIKSPSQQDENPCYLCHQEHKGREALITNVSDARCLTCHVYGSFNQNHPEFDFIAESVPDDSTLKFPHVRHVQEVVKREKLTDIERACLYCHNPEPEGRHFQPIAFETHCQTCHLTPNVETPALRIKSLDDPLAFGVETLEMMRRRRGPASARLNNVSPAEFRLKPGERLVKSPVYHQDPWLMENLKQARRTLYPEADFNELLQAMGTVPSQNALPTSTSMMQEALQTLRTYADGLRARPEPEVQSELTKIDSLLKAAQRQLRRQPEMFADAKLVMPALSVNPLLTSSQLEELDQFTGTLTKPCQQCHMVAEAEIVRVREQQTVLHRAEFNHRAHILHRRCLECHMEIPIVAAETNGPAAQPLVDRAAIQNIPGIENCQQCHNPKESSNRCVTCHFFHPNKTNRSSMLLYLE